MPLATLLTRPAASARRVRRSFTTLVAFSGLILAVPWFGQAVAATVVERLGALAR